VSFQIDLSHPEMGYNDEGWNLTDPRTYEMAMQDLGVACFLPPVCYRSKIFQEMENEKIWTREWAAVGLQQQLVGPGDILPFTIGFSGIHIQKTNNDNYEARFNRHQHGGCRFVPEQCRTGKQTKCTIASCNYTRDSKAIRAQEDGEASDAMYKFVGLVPEKLHKVSLLNFGRVFLVNVDPGAKTENANHQGINIDNLADRALEIPQDISEVWYDFNCNWKLLGKHFIESVAWDTEPSWLFPNLLYAEYNGKSVIVVMQATGMNKTLARCYTPSSSLNSDKIDACLKSIGGAAENTHSEFVSWGTSLKPNTEIDRMPTVENDNFLTFQRYLISKITKEYVYEWNAPVMDGRMLQRR
jgi:hypothetical protein|tara:strand:- start:2423 stop:3490 length:1068 start_codon:yes stop_codon:yes gene_type:complete